MRVQIRAHRQHLGRGHRVRPGAAHINETYQTVPVATPSHATRLERRAHRPRDSSLGSAGGPWRMSLPQPADADQSLLLEAIWEACTRDQKWPAFHAVDREMHRRHRLDAVAVLQRMDPGLLVRGRSGAPPGPDEALRLTIAGVAACPGTKELVERFLVAVRRASAVEEGYDGDEQPTLTADQVVAGASNGGSLPPAMPRVSRPDCSDCYSPVSRGPTPAPSTTGAGPSPSTGRCAPSRVSLTSSATGRRGPRCWDRRRCGYRRRP